MSNTSSNTGNSAMPSEASHNLGTVNMSQSKLILRTIARSKPLRPTIIRGRHAIGKSESVYQIAEEFNLPVIERRASQMTEGDLLGIPDPQGVVVENVKASKFNPPDWFAKAMTEPSILFFDEIDRAPIEVRQGIFELCDSRKLWGNYLHEDTIIIAAINGGLHQANYIGVRDLDRAELSRYYVIDLEPTVEEWFRWAQNNIHQAIIDFLQKFPGHLEHIGAFPSTTKVYPDRRGWKWLSDVLVSANAFAEGKANIDLISLLATARVGIEAAQSLVAFLGNYKFQIKPEEIFEEGKFHLLEGWEMNDYATFMNAAEEYLTKEMDDNTAKNMATYLTKYVPAELTAALVTLSIKKNFKNMLKFAKDNRELSEKVAEALRDQYAGKISSLENGE